MTKPNSKNRKRIRNKSKFGNSQKRYKYKTKALIKYWDWLEKTFLREGL